MESDRGSAVVVNTTPAQKMTIIGLLALVSVAVAILGKEAARQRSRVQLRVRSHICLKCYLAAH